eukprot:4453896-Ditylum_brightwellii.AAC.1
MFTRPSQQSFANQEDNQWRQWHCQRQKNTGTMAAWNTLVMEHFWVKEIPKQTGMPSWDSIYAIHLSLNANAASVPSDLGGGQHGHLSLTIGGTEYQTLTGHAFTRPAIPGLTPPPGNPYELPAQQADHIQ